MKTNYINTTHKKEGLLHAVQSLSKSICWAALIAWCLLGISACKKFVQIPAPTTQFVSSSVFSNNASATSAIVNIYEEMYSKSESFNMAQQTGFLGDELKDYSTNAQLKQYYTNSMKATNIFGPWNNAYHYIYEANAIIEGLQSTSGVDNAIKKQLTGEAKFIRAFWFFYLTNCYGDVPLVITTNYNSNASISRSPQAQVYNQIVTDLKEAKNLLNSNYVDASDTTVTTERTRPTKWAASALLARTYLYAGDFPRAYSESSSVIANTEMFGLPSDLNQVFKMNSQEAIWQIGIPLPNAHNTQDGFNFILQGAPKARALSTYLLNAFETGDLRRSDWVGSYTTPKSPITTYYYPFKYQVYNSTEISEYQMILRLAEQYLIKSEAQAQGAGNGVAGAISDLNTIRNRAGLPNYSGLTDKTSLLNAILHERQVELFTEWGDRWFSLIRSGNINTTMGSPGNICQAKGGVWDASNALFPIYQREIGNDHNLIQNPGY